MNETLCDKVNMVDVSPLADIASAAGKRPVISHISAITHKRDDMLDLKRKIEHSLGRMTILTAVSRP